MNNNNNNNSKEENRKVLARITTPKEVEALKNVLENEDKILCFSARYNSVKKEHVVEIYVKEN